jgi:tetratricopeptide (TPR) repeat protein
MWIANLTQATDSKNSFDVMKAGQEFESRCPKPDWWDRIIVSGVSIYTYDDLLSYWQNKDRSKPQFFKAAYKAILEYPLDTDIVVNAIKLMNYTYSYPYRVELQEYAIEKHFSYRNPHGKPGDSVAGIVDNLAQLYNNAGQYGKSVQLIEKLLKERETEINDHLLELIHLTYAAGLGGQNRPDEAVNVLKRAIARYNGDWEKRLNEAVARYDRTAHVPLSKPSPSSGRGKKKEPWWRANILIIGGTLLAAVLIFVLGRASKQHSNPSEVYRPTGLGTDYDVEQLTLQGRKIEAIRLYRQIHPVGLNEAKYAVDQIGKKWKKPT